MEKVRRSLLTVVSNKIWVVKWKQQQAGSETQKKMLQDAPLNPWDSAESLSARGRCG